MTERDASALLHEPDLMLAVLRMGALRPSTVDDCIEHLRTLRRCARIAEPIPEREVRTRLETARAKLQRARLIEGSAPGRFRTTARGRQVLADNPDGVDDTVLMQLPEFRPANGAARAAAATSPDPSQRAPSTEYQRGYEAYLTGVNLADNPHPPDIRAALDWENGWSQARDEHLSQHPQAESRATGAGRGSGRASDR